jgi:hypothetical protein
MMAGIETSDILPAIEAVQRNEAVMVGRCF